MNLVEMGLQSTDFMVIGIFSTKSDLVHETVIAHDTVAVD